MTIKQELKWNYESIPYKDLKDDQLVLCYYNNRKEGDGLILYQWDANAYIFLDANEGIYNIEPEECEKDGLRCWAYFGYPEREEK